MSKFWAAAGILLAVGIALTFYPAQDDINFTDLETECQYDRGSVNDVDLDQRRLVFSGYFPVSSPEADLNYDYSVSGDTVALNVKSSGAEPVTDYRNNCEAVAVYDAETGPIEPGRYLVKVSHDGEEVDRRVISIN